MFDDDTGEPARGFCDHCHGQRFDRARVLRALRQVRTELRASDRRAGADDAIRRAIAIVRGLEIPHLEYEDDVDSVVH